MIRKLLFLGLFLFCASSLLNAQIFSEDFENGQGSWTFTDNDGDTYNWDLLDASGLNASYGSNSIVSWSYIDNVGVLQPDNLATSPSISIPATANNAFLKFTYETQPGYPAENYSIYVTTSTSVSAITSSTPVYNETVTTGGIPVERVIDLSNFTGQNVYVTFRHHDCTDQYYLVIDNISIEELPANDTSMLSITTPETIASGNQNITGEIKNQGAQTISSVELNWQVDGGNVYTQNVTGLNIGINESYSFTHPDQWNATPGSHNLTVWASEVNGSSLANSQNTTSLTKAIQVATGSTTKTPIFERFTSATCGPCATFNNQSFNNFYAQRNSEFVYITYHMNYPGNGDPYYQTEASTRHNYYGVGGVPSLFTNGEEFVLAGTYASITQRLNDDLDAMASESAFMEFTNTSATLNGQTVSVDLDILPYLNGQYNVFAAVIERETTGNVVPVNLGGNGETEFTDIMMKMAGNPEGNTVTFTADSPSQSTLTADLSNSFVEDFDDLEVVAFIQNPNNKQILQAVNIPLGQLSTKNHLSKSEVNIYPNPTKVGYINIDVLQTATANIYDLSGRIVRNNLELTQGTNKIATSELSSGVYLVKINSNNKTLTQKIIIE